MTGLRNKLYKAKTSDSFSGSVVFLGIRQTLLGKTNKKMQNHMQVCRYKRITLDMKAGYHSLRLRSWKILWDDVVGQHLWKYCRATRVYELDVLQEILMFTIRMKVVLAVQFCAFPYPFKQIPPGPEQILTQSLKTPW